MKISKRIAAICLVLGMINTLNVVTYTMRNDSPINRDDLKRFKS